MPSLAGPRRPQDRVELGSVAGEFREHFTDGLVANGAGPHYEPVDVTVDGETFPLQTGSVAIAAITSCTNTSNPSVMVGAGLLAKKAVEKGLTTPPWVKTSLAPGSRAVTGYLDRAGLTPFLDELRFDLVGYGCTTCIGNSGPLAGPIDAAIEENGLVAAAVLSGNRNFEGRIHPSVRASYLASPPLVVAYALAGRVDIDLTTEPLGEGADGPVYLKDIWPTQEEVAATLGSAVNRALFEESYATVFEGDERWRALPVPDGQTYAWDGDSTYVQLPPFFTSITPEPAPVTDIVGARALAVLGDSITTDHISPAGSIPASSPAGRYLIEHGVEPRDFNSFGSRRGNHEVMMRGTFANIRLRNALGRRQGGRLDRVLAHRRDHLDLRGLDGLPGLRHPADRARRGAVRQRLEPRLGRQGHPAARRPRGHRQVVRAHPPRQPGRHGRAAAPVPRGRGPRGARPDRARDLRPDRPGRACSRATR